MSNIAFVLGNGTSRKHIPLEPLKKHGKVYGCNALYREFAPDHLVAVDTKMIIEISEARYQLQYNVWSNANKLTQKTAGIKLMEPNKGWSSGPTAMLLASQHGYRTIYVLGFDYIGLGDKQEKVNNLYAGTENYVPKTNSPIPSQNWIIQWKKLYELNPNTKFFKVNKSTEPSKINNPIEEWKNIKNIIYTTYDKCFFNR